MNALFNDIYTYVCVHVSKYHILNKHLQVPNSNNLDPNKSTQNHSTTPSH